MMDFETEEQQIEALKKWWKDNGRTIIAGFVIGVSVIAGWRYYIDYQRNHAEYASSVYEKILLATNNKDAIAQQQMDVNKLLAEYSDTPYASLAALIFAKSQFENGDVINAQQNLEWVMLNSKQAELKHLARTRMIRLMASMQKYDDALKLATVDYPESFAVIYEELKGDIYVFMQRFDDARAAYDKAILASSQQPSQWLRLKRDDLGEPMLKEPSA
ncbi:MAG: tetratricopeptide repeat protein [Gammaproteobacteria bacterium]|nr:tetratricopeptide repeat protein [Gammaproteobacteria bacterium]